MDALAVTIVSGSPINAGCIYPEVDFLTGRLVAMVDG
jgi:hypothetical protein